jgi:hypothetical protein
MEQTILNSSQAFTLRAGLLVEWRNGDSSPTIDTEKYLHALRSENRAKARGDSVDLE